MAWVRYDDQFHHNRKVTAVVAEDAGAIGLHTLANTWTNSQPKYKGFVPAHQPGVLICDKERAPTWAALLVKQGLWHDVASMCPECKEEYADLPAGLEGFVFHNAEEYRAAARERTAPGTSADLSAKRRAAGRKGGAASARKRDEGKQKQAKPATGQANQANQANDGATEQEQPASEEHGPSGDVLVGQVFTRPAETQQTDEANQANGVSKSSNLLLAGVSPVPVPEPVVASDEATPPKNSSSPASPARDSEPFDEPESDDNSDLGAIPGLRAVPQSAKKPEPGSDDDPDFVKFWNVYPKKSGKPDGRKAWAKAVKKTAPAVIIAGAERYAGLVAFEGREKRHMKDPSGWLNGERWTDEIDTAQQTNVHRLPNRNGTSANANGSVPGTGALANVNDYWRNRR